MTKELTHRCLWSCLCLFLLMTGTVFAQKSLPAVKGVVQSETGDALPGVTVTVQNKKRTFTKTTQTDDKGMFVFETLKQGGPYSFSFTYVGYERKALDGYAYNGDVITLSVSLTQQNKAMSDVVVVGYGTQRKANLTGAVDQVGSEYFSDRPAASATRGLEGVIPNLNITITDGKPTATSAYNIRGMTSIGVGANPGALVLIDGVPGDPSTLNPNDIASVSVLKDASSAAIYGSRGAFGVVLITTKSPAANKVTVTYDASYSVNARTVTPKLVTNGYQFAVGFDSAYQAWYDYLSQPQSVSSYLTFSAGYLDSLQVHNANPALPKVTVNPATGAYQYYGNTDWQKILYAPYIPETEHALNIAGGSDKVNFSLSGRYYNQGGLFRYNSDNYNDYNLRFKGFVKVNKWLSITSNTDFSTFDYKYPLTSISNSSIWQLISSATQPMALLYNPDGTLTNAAALSVGDFAYGQSFSKSKQYFLRNTLGFTANVIRDKLTLNGDFSYLYTNTSVTSQLFPVPFSNVPGVIVNQGTNSLGYTDSLDTYMASNLYATYHQNFGAHSIKLTVGGNIESDLLKKMATSRNGLIVNDLPDFNLATGSNVTVTGGGSQWATAGIFYRANYSFADKYLLELDGRYDGSSKFPLSQQFGFFPSASAGWRVSDERFMRFTRTWLDGWKLRASYGSLGNGQINPYLYLPIMGTGIATTIVNGVFPSYISKPNVIPGGLTWERSTTADFGTDIDVLKRRLSMNVDWYQRRTTGMITGGEPQPAVFGATVPYGNNANLETQGFEVSLNWNDQIKMRRPLAYGLRVTLANNVAHITKFDNPTGSLASGFYYKGERLGDIWGFVDQGFFTSQADIAGHANQKYIVVSNNNIPLPGDIKFADIGGGANGKPDGVINTGNNTLSNPGDQKIIGNTTPRYMYGITPFVAWNNFSLSAFLQGVGKRDWWPGSDANFFWGQYNRPYGDLPISTLDHWTPTNPNGYFPRYRGYVALSSPRELFVPQTRYLQNASYIRLKNLTLGYDLPGSVIRHLRVSGLKFYLTGQNLWTHSPLSKHAPAFDPEVLGSDPAVSPSGNGDDYPMLKSYTFGLNLTF